MGKTKNGTRYPEELRARAVRMVLDHEGCLDKEQVRLWRT